DRLIKETAARWRMELREIDVLARLDGVEFALILPGCGLAEAVDVVDRVRAGTPRGQTASAGVARWDGEEPAELLLVRAQDAPAAFNAQFAPSTATVDAVRSWAGASGLSVESVSANRTLVRLSGSAAAVGKAFGTTLQTFQAPDGSTFYAPSVAAKLPAAFSG